MVTAGEVRISSSSRTSRRGTRVAVLNRTDLDRILITGREMGYKLLWTFTKTLSRCLRETNEKMAASSPCREGSDFFHCPASACVVY